MTPPHEYLPPSKETPEVVSTPAGGAPPLMLTESRSDLDPTEVCTCPHKHAHIRCDGMLYGYNHVQEQVPPTQQPTAGSTPAHVTTQVGMATQTCRPNINSLLLLVPFLLHFLFGPHLQGAVEKEQFAAVSASISTNSGVFAC